MAHRSKSFLEDLWIAKIFAAEFGFSDVLANYSRTYAWMANQLGHMTLGLGVALVYAALFDTLAATWVGWRDHRDWVIAGGVVAAAGALWVGVDFRFARKRNRPLNATLAARCGFAALGALLFAARVAGSAQLSAALMGLVCGVTVIAGLGAAVAPLLGEKEKTDQRWEQLAEKPPYLLIGKIAHWIGFAVVLAAAALGLWAARGSADEPLHATVAALMMAAALLLSQDLRFAVLAMVTLAFAAVLAGWPADTPWGGSGAHTGMALAAGFLAVGVWIASTSGPLERLGSNGAPVKAPRQASLLVWSAVGAATLAAIALIGPHADWRGPIAAAIASVAVWGVKEFGSDQPNVHLDLEEAAKIRNGNCGEDVPRHIHDEYLRDAINDTWADSAFYVAGAMVAAAVLSPLPIFIIDLDDPRWAQGAVILGLLVFVVGFLVIGREWALRQQALDLCGCQRANRLAVYTSRIVLWLGAAARSDQGNPLERLHHFSRFEPARFNPEGAPPFRHLIVFGGPGSGKAPLGEALASEAALRHLDSGVASPWRTLQLDGRPPAPRPKSSRVMSAEALVSITERLEAELKRSGAKGRRTIAAKNFLQQGGEPLIAYRMGDVRCNPTVDLFVCPADRDKAIPKSQWRVTRDVVHDGAPDFHGADLVVITDVRDHHDLAAIARALVPQGKQTVWLWEGVGFAAPGSDDAVPAAFLDRRSKLSAGLGVQAEDIAIAFVSRNP